MLMRGIGAVALTVSLSSGALAERQPGRHASNIMHDGSRLRRKVFGFNGRNVGAQSRGD
jgi:hypothetical protein